MTFESNQVLYALIMFILPKPLPAEVKLGEILNLSLITDARGPFFSGVLCDEEGKITLWYDTEEAPDRTRRDNRIHHSIQGLDRGCLEFEGKQLLDFRGEWFDWAFHPHGVLLCFQDRLYLVVLSLTPAS